MVTGNIKSANQYDFSQQNIVTGSRVLGTVYQNTTGRTMFVSVYLYVPSAAGWSFKTDDVNPPTNVVTAAGTATGDFAQNESAPVMVLPGNFYQITVSGGVSIIIWTEYT